MKATRPLAGAWWFIQAIAQSRPAASIHMGSGPGVVGLSGIQVNPFDPLRKVTLLPSGSIATTVAASATALGAASNARRIRASGPPPDARTSIQCTGGAPAAVMASAAMRQALHRPNRPIARARGMPTLPAMPSTRIRVVRQRPGERRPGAGRQQRLTGPRPNPPRVAHPIQGQHTAGRQVRPPVTLNRASARSAARSATAAAPSRRRPAPARGRSAPLGRTRS